MSDETTPTDATTILEFWYGTLDAEGLTDEAHTRRWWVKDPAFDTEITQRFAALHHRAVAGELSHWDRTPRGRLALIIVLDQFSRNMFRDTAQMYAADPQAIALALGGIDNGEDRALATDERVFLYMPLMHSEDLARQERCLSLFQDLCDSLEGPARARIGNNVAYAREHRDIIARWGRFPHRNALLGRKSSDAEIAFLKEPGSSF